MSSVGLRVSGETGIVQIDSDYSNYEVVQAGSARHAEHVYYPTTGDASNLVFCRGPIGSRITRGLPGPGGQWPGANGFLGYEKGNYFVPFVLSGGGPVDYVVMSKRNRRPQPMSGWGIAVNDAAGQCVYTSLDQNLSIVASLLVGVSISEQAFKLPVPMSGKKLYVLINPLYGTRFRRVGGSLLAYSFAFRFTSDTQLIIESFALTENWGAGSVITGAEDMPSGHQANILVAEY